MPLVGFRVVIGMVNFLPLFVVPAIEDSAEAEMCRMKRNTEDVRPRARQRRHLDGFDRKILAALTGDAGLTYAEIGQAVGLSAPAVHERVRRLKESGVLAGTTT